MDATPAGWYDDPDDPGQQRYWDGSAWTEERVPNGAAPTPPPGAPAPPPAAPPMPPPGAAAAPSQPPSGSPTAPGGPYAPPPSPTAKGSGKAVWIVLAVIVAVVVLVGGAILAITVFGGSDVTETVEENLPQSLEDNFTAQGLEVTITQVDCDSISDSDGPFTTDCAITIEGLSEPLDATITGSVNGNTVRVTSADSDTNVLNDTLAVQAAQSAVDEIDPTVGVVGCTLPEPLVLVRDGLDFSCELDTDETVEFGIDGGQLSILSVE